MNNQKKDLNSLVGSHNILMITLDALRYDAAVDEMTKGNLPYLQKWIPDGKWQKRHTPGNFSFSAHMSFFSGFLPTPASPGKHTPLFAIDSSGIETPSNRSYVFEEPNIVTGLASVGYHTLCIGGDSFFDKQSPLGRFMPSLFETSLWEPSFGVTDPDSTWNQVNAAIQQLETYPPGKNIFLFLNVSALHQPNYFYLEGNQSKTDSLQSHAAALHYVDSQLPPLFEALQNLGPCFSIICSPHGTAYGEDGYSGHGIGHPKVWTVPYAEFILPAAQSSSQSSGGQQTTFHLDSDLFISDTPISGQQLKQLLNHHPFQGNLCSYPHKTAYRPIPPVSLQELWQEEKQEELFLYVHIPFCQPKCGFCNQLSYSGTTDVLAKNYIKTMGLQANAVSRALPNRQISHIAIGGGSAGVLEIDKLVPLFDILESVMKVDLPSTPVSVEITPGSVEPAKLALFKESHVDRISIGIQSFIDLETRAAFRNGDSRQSRIALEKIASFDFPDLSIDLIYGLPGQTVESWLYSLKTTIYYKPREIYLYPLYSGQHSVLGDFGSNWSNPVEDIRMTCYQIGRDYLLANDYQQISMCVFKKIETDTNNKKIPLYNCQETQMVGLGCDISSCTSGLHYSSGCAVSPDEVNKVIETYNQQSAQDFETVNYGYVLDQQEQKLAYLLKSLLRTDGLNKRDYFRKYKSNVSLDFPKLQLLRELGYLEDDQDFSILTTEGISLSHGIGPWLMSRQVKEKMAQYRPQ